MKILFTSILYFLFIIIKSQSTDKEISTLEVKYTFSYVADTLNKESRISETMVLLTNGKKSIYYGENYKAFSDGLKKQINSAIQTGSIVEPGKLPKARVRHTVFKDNDLIFISNILGSNTLTYPAESIKWIIDNSVTKDILGYKCSKATAKIGNRNYTAWFTYNIPMSDGPYKFKGLPGLILSINEIHHYFNFELLSINKASHPINFKKGISVTEQQYVMKRTEYLEDPSEGRINTPEYRKSIEERNKKYNNFLEN